jgi:hypothetical protein
MTATWLDPEERAYPRGGFTRRGRAVLRENEHNPVALPYGQARAVRASIPDTYFSIPARVRHAGRTVAGYLSRNDDGPWVFTPDADPARCTQCESGQGCRYSVSERVR